MAGFNFQTLVDDVEKLASKAAEILPGAGLVDDGLKIGQSIISLIDSLKSSGKAADVSDLDTARHTLQATIGPEADELSKELRGQ
jgi:hypothetical protein